MLFPLYHLYQNGKRHFQFDIVWPGHDHINKKLNFAASFFNLQPHLLPSPKGPHCLWHERWVRSRLWLHMCAIALVWRAPCWMAQFVNWVCFQRVFPSPSSTVICISKGKGGLSPFPLPFFLPSVVDVLNILYLTIFMNNLWSITIKLTVLLYHILCLV